VSGRTSKTPQRQPISHFALAVAGDLLREPAGTRAAWGLLQFEFSGPVLFRGSTHTQEVKPLGPFLQSERCRLLLLILLRLARSLKLSLDPEGLHLPASFHGNSLLVPILGNRNLLHPHNGGDAGCCPRVLHDIQFVSTTAPILIAVFSLYVNKGMLRVLCRVFTYFQI